MDFNLTRSQVAWRSRAEALAAQLAIDASAGDVIAGAARHGLLDGRVDLLSLTAAAEAIAYGSPSAALSYALHAVVLSAVRDDRVWTERLVRGDVIGALALSAEEVPVDAGGRLTGGASWVAPVTTGGVVVLGARSGDEVSAYMVRLGADGVTAEPERAAGLRGLACARLALQDAPAHRIGATVPIMVRVRVLMAGVGLGIGRRAFAEALHAARAAGGGAAGKQTVQGLLADAATELDAARLLTWAAAADADLSLGNASAAKLIATGAAQHAVEYATQIVGVETFRQGHVVERLSQDVRALELFAGRTEALRAAVATETLPSGPGTG